MGIEVGKPAPDFCLPDQDEVQRCLKDYRGKWVVLYFYPKDNTSGCTKEAQGFTAMKEEFEKLGAVILGVSPDSPRSHRNFRQKKGLTITLLSDPQHQVMELYGAWGMKRSRGKEKAGVIRSTVLIDPQGILRFHWPRVKVAGHVEDVLEKLRELKGK